MSRLERLIDESKRRRVFRVAVVYAPGRGDCQVITVTAQSEPNRDGE
jgi:hypothetical protein